MRGTDEVQAKKWDVLWKNKGVKDIEIGHIFSIHPGLEISSTFSYTFPFSIMQLSVFLVGSYVILFPLPLAVREAYEIPLWCQKQTLKPCYGATFGDIHLPKVKYRAFLPVSNAALSCEGRL